MAQTRRNPVRRLLKLKWACNRFHANRTKEKEQKEINRKKYDDLEKEKPEDLIVSTEDFKKLKKLQEKKRDLERLRDIGGF